MDESPRTLAPLGCVVFIILGATIGLFGLAYIASEEYKSTHEYDWWILALYGITILYPVLNSRYIWVLPRINASVSESWFIIGRMLCFLSFPSFAYIIALSVWYVIRTTNIATVLGLIGGWLITKALQKTIFAHEYINRDKF